MKYDICDVCGGAVRPEEFFHNRGSLACSKECNAKLSDAVRAAVEEMRERAAKVAENHAGQTMTGKYIADDIRKLEVK